MTQISDQDRSLAHHVSQLMPLPDARRDDYLAGLNPQVADELRSLLRYSVHAEDLTDAAAVSVAREILQRPPPSHLGRWTVLETIAVGGMGTVLLVEREELGVTQRGAAKLSLTQGNPAQLMAAIRSEADALSRLSHPNLATLLDFGVSDTAEPYIVSEFVEGRQILDHAANHALGSSERLALFAQLLDGVAAAHAAMVLHLDIKPANILVTHAGLVKLIDFGLAGVLRQDRPAGQQSQAARGLTRAFASPEQLAGEPVTVRSDVYSLGLLLAELLSGHQARGGRLNQRELAAVVAKATASNPLHRYASASAFGHDIQALLTNQPVSPLAGFRRYRWRKLLRRHWLVFACVGVAVLALIGGLVGVHHQYRKTLTEHNRALRLLESERATSDFVTQSLRRASVFGGGNAELTVGEMLRVMLVDLPQAEKMSDRSKAWLASDLAAVFTGLGWMDQALAASHLAVSHAQKSEDPEDDITHWTQLALTAGQAHEYATALHAAEQARVLAQASNHWRLPWAYLAQMQTLVKMKRWREVVPLWQQIAAIPTDRVSVRGNSDYMRGTAYVFLEQFDAARRDLESAESIYTQRYGANSVPVADVHFRRFQLLLRSAALDEARTAAPDVAARLRQAYGDDHYRNAAGLAEVGLLDYYQGRNAQAQSTLAQAIGSLLVARGADSPLAAYYQGQLARVLLQQRQADQALEMAETAAARLLRLGRDHPDRLLALVGAVEAAVLQGDADRAQVLLDEVHAHAGIDVETSFRAWRAQSIVHQMRGDQASCLAAAARAQRNRPVLSPPDPFEAATRTAACLASVPD